ncbi:hypothetical protein BN12_290019 [Nostocoides japonicum T1-X7]|uniref:Uncharacterized protein n=1 Tax=Nostocoides japonicum T1-X7 TaxID=1194083 RepID=A0A077M2H3_9MICO|nr:hypothetical protein BN12_290019 [Tetrasphaera japonica T1-X7]
MYSETWPISGTTHDGSAYPLPMSAHHIPGPRLHPRATHYSEPRWRPTPREAGRRWLRSRRAEGR